jgi:hypothetical protein
VTSDHFQPEDDRPEAGSWGKPFGLGLAVSLLPLAAWLAVVLSGVVPHSYAAAAVVLMIGATIVLCELLAFLMMLLRKTSRPVAFGIGTGLLMSLGLHFTLGRIVSFGCGYPC